MQALDVNSLFARAEQAFAAGRFDAAHADLGQLQRLTGEHPAVLHLLALVEKKRGDLEASRAAFERALRHARDDAQINNNYANLLDLMGDVQGALAHFDRVLAATPRFTDARFNRAILLQRLGRLEEALPELDAVAAASPRAAKVHSARAGVLRDLGRLAEAQKAYDAALQLEPRRLVALHGRARLAMERGESDAPSFYKRALEQKPGDPELQLGYAEALEAAGDPSALDVLAAAVAANPTWIEGQATLSRMRWEAGEGREFTRAFEQAVAAAPQNRALWFGYASALAAADLSAEAADAAARGRATVGEDRALQLLEAVHASEAGQIERADRLYADLPPQFAGRNIHEARHLIRKGRYDDALDQAERARAEDAWSVSAWALIGLLWRICDDPRAQWLHEQSGLVAAVDLGLSASDIDRIADRLRSLHRTKAHPIGQSLRGGTQTRGRLFEREDSEIRLLRDAVFEGVINYWAALPALDPRHPLLRHRHAAPRFDGSWSVRLSAGGFHISHVHPHGILSSACYLVVPTPSAPGEGWLEVGSAPHGLDLPLQPLVRIEPKPGRMALFPSTLFHGTRPFGVGERISAAFDLSAVPS